ncbi:hypothetical protein SBBP2_150012 [Burkholderiales bacterium]|nr:hypothetical protein SBBP2_150012 [Burkholderiales bacterium]
MRIATMFELEGEAGFRERETQLLDELTAKAGIVLATGGGAVLRPENRARLRSRGLVIFLDASAGEIARRTQHDVGRPLLNAADRRARQPTGGRASNPCSRSARRCTGRLPICAFARRRATPVVWPRASWPIRRWRPCSRRRRYLHPASQQPTARTRKMRRCDELPSISPGARTTS